MAGHVTEREARETQRGPKTMAGGVRDGGMGGNGGGTYARSRLRYVTQNISGPPQVPHSLSPEGSLHLSPYLGSLPGKEEEGVPFKGP